MTQEQPAVREDMDFLRRIDGLFVGMLDAPEIAKFDELVRAGLAYRSYEGAGGIMGLAKARRFP